jgi:predicted component of type VI protein secretion system
MAKLVILSQGLTGKFHELKVDKTTIGRVDDNTFPVADPSVSSHHCEILMRGSFINGEKITESVLKPGQILRLGQIEFRLETDAAPGAAPATAPAAPAASAKKGPDNTVLMTRGVSLTDLEQGAKGFDTSGKGFSKKDNKANKMFFVIAVIVVVIIIGLLIYTFAVANKPAQ